MLTWTLTGLPKIVAALEMQSFVVLLIYKFCAKSCCTEFWALVAENSQYYHGKEPTPQRIHTTILDNLVVSCKIFSINIF